MPSLPTSLILVGLVVAWLVVLVPMVSKRREHVPESEEDSGSYRVVSREKARERSPRPVLSRTAMAHESDAESGDVDAGSRDVDVELRVGGDDDRDAGSNDSRDDVRGDVRDEGDDVVAVADPGDDDSADDDVVVTMHAKVSGTAQMTETAEVRDTAEHVKAADAGDAGETGEPATVTGVGANDDADAREWSERGNVEHIPDAADDWEAENSRTSRRKSDEPLRVRDDRGAVEDGRAYRTDARADYRADEISGDDRNAERAEERAEESASESPDPAYDRAAPVRHGRGGFDPREAEKTKMHRYRQRRRVALILLALAAAGAGVGALGKGYGWTVTITAGALLVLYLAYLRRQVQIEEEIRQRRAARLARARQIRPGYRPSVAEQVYAHRTGEILRPGDARVLTEYRATSHARPSVPPSTYLPGTPVDLDDNDPAFDELDYYQPAMYRRRAG